MKLNKVGVYSTVIATVLFFSFVNITPAASLDFGFFKGKVINYIVATKPGGGYDTYARVIGKYMQKFIPGVTVVVRNVPGAGHIIGANEIYFAKPDGLTIGTFDTALIYSQIAGFQGIKFDLAKYSWIGKASSETRVLIVGVNTPYKTFKDILDSKEPVKMAAAGVGGGAYNDVMIFTAATGAPFKVIPGYGGREGEMAILRGEVSGHFGSYTGLSGFILSKDCRVLVQVGEKKHKDLSNVPLASDLKISDKAKKIIAMINGTAEIGRLTAGPPNIPASRMGVLRDTYEKALNDPAFLKEAGKLALDIDPGYGESLSKLVKEVLNQPQENVEMLKKIINIGHY